MSDKVRREQARLADLYNLRPGDTFSTAGPDGQIIETGCTVVALTADYPFSFDALDSEGVLCQFDIRMIVADSIRSQADA